MTKKYIYNGFEYLSEFEVRKAIKEKDHKIFSKAPIENAEDFWTKLGVTIIEEQEPFEPLKARKAFAIKRAFLDWRNNKATLVSSLGFKADSNERANTDVSGLLIAHENDLYSSITFRDADNEFHSLTYAQVKTLQKEIIENGNYAYEQKWTLDAQVEKAMTKEELDAIKVVFVGKDFTKE